MPLTLPLPLTLTLTLTLNPSTNQADMHDNAAKNLQSLIVAVEFLKVRG